MLNSDIAHKEIALYADNKVNLPSDLVKDYRAQVNNLRDKLEKHIEANPGFGLVKMLNSGSVAKGTALKTINDMDVAVYMKQDIGTSEAELLAWLMLRLKDAYPNLKPEQFSCPPQAHCVTISYRSTGGTGLDVDVVPVLVDESLTGDYGYLVTRDTGDRVLTNISLHLEFIRKRKNAQPHHFRQVARLVKWWARQHKNKDSTFRFKSLMIELICAHLVDNGLDMTDYPVALQKVFTYIVKTELKQPISFIRLYSK